MTATTDAITYPYYMYDESTWAEYVREHSREYVPCRACDRCNVGLSDYPNEFSWRDCERPLSQELPMPHRTAQGERTFFVVVHEIDRAFGGREEGGWWYDVGTAITSVPVVTLMGARIAYAALCREYAVSCRRCGLREHEHPTEDDYCDRFAASDVGSVAYSGGVYSVSLSDAPAADYPEASPRYE